jgi:hypothetical protein
LSTYQWIGPNHADLGNGANWTDTSGPGNGQPPGVNDVAIIHTGGGLQGVLNVATLDLIHTSGAPQISITGSSTQVTAASVVMGFQFTLDTGAYLQAGTLGIDGGGTTVTVQNNAFLEDSAGQNDVFTIGTGSGNASLLVTLGGTVDYHSQASSGTLNLGGASGSHATLTVSSGGYFGSALSSVNIGAASGATGILDVTGADSQFIVDNQGTTTIGDYGERGGGAEGVVEVTDGAYASFNSAGGVDIGTSAGLAYVEVTGPLSAIEAGSSVEIGVSGTKVAGDIGVGSGGEFDAAADVSLNQGTIGVSGYNSLFTARILSANAGTTIEVTTEGTMRVADVELGGKLTLEAGSVDARETFALSGGSEVLGIGTMSAAKIFNAGEILAKGGTLAVIGPITGTGTLAIASGAELALAGTVAGTQNILFGAGANELGLDDPYQMAGHILNFATGDTIDLIGVAATQLSYAAGALTITDGSDLVGKLQVRGIYTTANFKLGSDGHGGSLIRFVPAGGAEHGPIGVIAGPHLVA